ncbi:hypothetical protein [Parabacteroides distasonis]|uniref:hypothetical protein n=1 Tax=Parabacteroides distasonis TaxID=823 RepID=UPI00321A2FC3
MIDIKSLRLNNVVQVYDWYKDKKYKLFHVISIDRDSEYINLSDRAIKTSIPYKEIEPVPLTEDILLKYGFKKDRNSFCIGDWDCDFTLRHYSNEVFYMVNVSESQLFGPEIKYLHQLQNLYYALENKELEEQP